MADMLVKLYELEDIVPILSTLRNAGFDIRPGHPSEKHIISEWAAKHFKERWGTACEVGLEQRPVTCHIAVQKGAEVRSQNPYDLPDETLVGFACYDVARKGVFGPMGVREEYRHRGIGRALLLSCLHAMVRDGYDYAIIGQVGPTEFYEKSVGAIPIQGSEPGSVRGRLIG